MSCVGKNPGSQSFDRSVQTSKRTSPSSRTGNVSSIEQSGLIDSSESLDTFSSAGVTTASGAGATPNVVSMLYQILNILQSFLGGSQDVTSLKAPSISSGGKGKPAAESFQGTDGLSETDPSEKPSSNKKTNSSGNTSKPSGDTPAVSKGGSSVPSKSGIESMDRWDSQIQAAAESTGLPANYIKATIWAESRGNPSTATKNPYMDAIDEGVMQISNETYADVMSNQPNAPRGLKASNPADSIMMGAWELKDKSEKAGGDLKATSRAYRGHGNDRDRIYADNVATHMQELDSGKPLSQDPNGNPDG